jgi:phage shock protein E
MANRITLMLALLMVSIFSLAESSSDALRNMPKNAYGYTVVDVSDFMKVAVDKDFALVNVHIPYGGEIPGTDASIAFNDLQAISSAFPDKEAPLVIYCRSGSMSRQTAQRLVQMGYQNVIDIAGGSNAWRNLGNPWVVR